MAADVSQIPSCTPLCSLLCRLSFKWARDTYDRLGRRAEEPVARTCAWGILVDAILQWRIVVVRGLAAVALVSADLTGLHPGWWERWLDDASVLVRPHTHHPPPLRSRRDLRSCVSHHKIGCVNRGLMRLCSSLVFSPPPRSPHHPLQATMFHGRPLSWRQRAEVHLRFHERVELSSSG